MSLPLPPPPRSVLGSPWRIVRPRSWLSIPPTVFSLLFLLFGEIMVGTGRAVRQPKDAGPLTTILFAILLVALLFALVWFPEIRRIRTIRRLCRDAPASSGIILAKRLKSGHFGTCVVTYLFTSPYTNDPVKLDGQVPFDQWQTLAPGDRINVLIDKPPRKNVVVYEFCGFTVDALPGKIETTTN